MQCELAYKNTTTEKSTANCQRNINAKYIQKKRGCKNNKSITANTIETFPRLEYLNGANGKKLEKKSCIGLI